MIYGITQYSIISVYTRKFYSYQCVRLPLKLANARILRSRGPELILPDNDVKREPNNAPLLLCFVSARAEGDSGKLELERALRMRPPAEHMHTREGFELDMELALRRLGMADPFVDVAQLVAPAPPPPPAPKPKPTPQKPPVEQQLHVAVQAESEPQPQPTPDAANSTLSPASASGGTGTGTATSSASATPASALSPSGCSSPLPSPQVRLSPQPLLLVPTPNELPPLENEWPPHPGDGLSLSLLVPAPLLSPPPSPSYSAGAPADLDGDLVLHPPLIHQPKQPEERRFGARDKDIGKKDKKTSKLDDTDDSSLRRPTSIRRGASP